MGILSVGSYGCNMSCNFCQNHSISQVNSKIITAYEHNNSPKDIVKRALELENNIGIAFTYNEPIVWYEYMLDVAKLCQKEGLKTVMVSNGYIMQEPLNELLPLIDAFNIDLKAYDNNFYEKHAGAKLKYVLESLKTISKAGKHLEITMLVIPEQNDDLEKFREMLNWISDNCGKQTVLHLSKYFPNYKSNQKNTPDRQLIQMYNIATEVLDYVYLGNTSSVIGRDTHCPACKKTIICRTGYAVDTSGFDSDKCCANCSVELKGFFTYL